MSLTRHDQSQASGLKGYLALVLHFHLPYVRHPESTKVIEERWLFEAITESYIPMVRVFRGLVRDQVGFRATVSLSPTLITMLSDPLLRERYVNYIDNLIALAHKECIRTSDLEQDARLNKLAQMYLREFLAVRDMFIACDGNLVAAFRELQDDGCLEVITCAATHAFLPYIRTEEAVRAQVSTAIETYRSHFGRSPAGFWLPECAYASGIDRILAESGVSYTIVDSHGLTDATPSPSRGLYAPVRTRCGVSVFARDQESSRQVWSAREGYPGDVDYREYYRDIGFDLPWQYLRANMPIDSLRLSTGIKYHKITGDGQAKDLYDPVSAREKAALHAGNFMFNRERQVEHLAASMDRLPIVVAPYDAELFGHWWYEGPQFIDYLCRKIFYDQSTIELATPGDYLASYPDSELVDLGMSSWGRGGHGEVWLQGANDWVYRSVHKMEERMTELSQRLPDACGMQRAVLNQAARELMLAESSDWTFILDSRSAVDYALARVKSHITRFHILYDMALSGRIDEKWLERVEQEDDIFPDIDYRIYIPEWMTPEARPQSKQRVLMLSWEFPPMAVGGLSRAVYDLSRALVEQGTEVHVVTCQIPGSPIYEVVNGVVVHRVQPYRPPGDDFMEWVFQLNLALLDRCRSLLTHGLSFTAIHAHDWLVTSAAKALKQEFGLGLVATIHATESGRNGGIYTDLQRRIDSLEWELTYEAEQVIVCSSHMRNEVVRLFHLPVGKVHVIPNGVDFATLVSSQPLDALRQRYALPHEKIVFYVGRLVREKGVQVLLESAPSIFNQHPEAKFVVAGKGPMLDELLSNVSRLGLGDKVAFAGFVDDDTRNGLLKTASVTVFPSLYEPFGIVALEAMASGVPLVVSQTGGMAEIIDDGHDGLAVPPGDAHALSGAIIRLLGDPDFGLSMAERARDKARSVYGWDSIARKMVDLYESISESTDVVQKDVVAT